MHQKNPLCVTIHNNSVVILFYHFSECICLTLGYRSLQQLLKLCHFYVV